MKLGFTSIYPFRPHVEHVYYLAKLMEGAGHDVCYLTCDAELASCYGRELKGFSKLRECPKCMLGGIRSFASAGVSPLRLSRASELLAPDKALLYAHSAACTITRMEADEDLETPMFREVHARLAQGAAQAYNAARAWIAREGLEGVICFNGRMEATRAICEAARDAGVPFVSVERTWFGDGLHLIPNENCIGLSEIDRMNLEYRDTPLTGMQAGRAAHHIASRFLRRNATEWRQYNPDAVDGAWPTATNDRRFLLVPSSRNELYGHPDWQVGWRSPTEGLDALIDTLGLQPEQVVLRCHPNWGERIGRRDGELSERLYTEWAKRRGVYCVDSRDKRSTYDLIHQADVIVQNGGSAGFEAGALGKQVVGMTPSIYQAGGFQTPVYLAADLPALAMLGERSADTIRRQTLRFGYTTIYRVPQYVDHVRAVTSSKYEYVDGADPERLERLLRSGRLSADDPEIAQDSVEEDMILQMLAERQWENLYNMKRGIAVGDGHRIHRRAAIRWLDDFRELFPKGDGK